MCTVQCGCRDIFFVITMNVWTNNRKQEINLVARRKFSPSFDKMFWWNLYRKYNNETNSLLNFHSNFQAYTQKFVSSGLKQSWVRVESEKYVLGFVDVGDYLLGGFWG